MKNFLYFTIAAVVTLLGSTIMACTNFLVTKGASADGSTFISYAADSHVLYGELYFRPAATYPAGTMMTVEEWDTGRKLGEIKQALNTYSVVGNINEYQLAIGETTFGGREELHDTTGIIDYGSLIYITLQRAKTAREAVKIMVELTDEYGYASEGESFSISDPNEVWYMEFTGRAKKANNAKLNKKGLLMVAYKIPDGYVSGHANQARITTIKKADGKTSITTNNLAKIFAPDIECVYTADIFEYCKAVNITSATSFDNFIFCDAIAPLTQNTARSCESRVFAGFMKFNKEAIKDYEDYARGDNLQHRMPLWIKPAEKVTLNKMFDVMRDHFEGTSMDMTKDLGAGPFACPYRWRPMHFTVDSVNYVHERATSTQQTGFSFIAQSRSWVRNETGGILWFGVDDSYTTVYMPMYCGINKIPSSIRVGNGSMAEYSDSSMFWLFNRVSNFAYSRYSDMIVDIQKEQRELESGFQKDVLNYSASSDYEKAKNMSHEEAVEFATLYSNMAADATFQRWEKLDKYLLVKYIDGNIKKTDEKGNFKTTKYGKDRIEFPSQPQYPEKWYRAIIRDCGDNIRVKE
ncbi:MAG: C69 family dipeptidase [Bacteroidales bacterium]|jgi:dipeptidase|nr:C69 family dipeptidase [Bacteroidales bacterium]